MPSHSHHMPTTASRHHQAAAYGAPGHMAHQAAAPAGTFSPGTKIQVGNHRVVIQKYLSQGGFAHVYLVKLPSPVDGTDLAVLKRVAVPDKDSLRGMRTEVETMKRLKGHRPIVTYMDSHASEMKGGGYEVFLLMEFCNGGGLIDFMNTRLQHRLTEPEILQIFTDVAEGVACMHYLKPALLHRDIKVENILITTVGSRKRFKVCDFGSASAPTPAPTSIVECRLMDEDVQKHTTLQYRSPEMVDVYRKQPIDEKSDIWALGVLLYKLCYYTTPFEDQGQLAIMNASFRFPPHPLFSDRLKKLISSMLQEGQPARPNIYQTLKEACAMQGREIPIQDIYSKGADSDARRERPAPDQNKPLPTPVVGVSFSPAAPKHQTLPDIVPMRRGRPAAGSQSATDLAKTSLPVTANTSPAPAPKITNGDPFAALDQKSSKDPSASLSSKFPALDEFSLLHNHAPTFNFDNSSPSASAPHSAPVQSATVKLADDGFVRPLPTNISQQPSLAASPPKRHVVQPPSMAVPVPKPVPAILQPAEASRPMMVSQGTMTTPPTDPREYPKIYKFPPADQARTSSLTKAQESLVLPRLGDGISKQRIASRTPSHHGTPTHARQPSSSRPSLEISRPNLDTLEPPKPRTSMTMRPRPASTHLESNLDFLRERENTKSSTTNHSSPKYLAEKKSSPRLDPEDQTAIQSNVEFLRSMEGDGRKDKIKHSKRPSLASIPGTKNILAGKFGNVFKKFEGINPSSQSVPRTPSPLKDIGRRDLAPIATSESANYRGDDGEVSDDEDDMSPEMRREMERRRLSTEEKRVAAAGAEYRKRVADRNPATTLPPPKSIGGVPRAVSIQNKVERLLDESQRPSSGLSRTAEGYGKYSDAATAAAKPADKKLPDIPRKAVGSGPVKLSTPTLRYGAGSTNPEGLSRPSSTIPSSSAAAAPLPTRPSTSGKPGPKPAPKPMHLNNMRTGPRAISPTKLIPNAPSRSQDTLVSGNVSLDMSVQEKEDYIRDFQERYPSLTALEMVEREIGTGAAAVVASSSTDGVATATATTGRR